MLLGCEGSGAARRATYRPTVSAPGSWNREKRDKGDGGQRGERGGEPHYTAADHERLGTRRRDHRLRAQVEGDTNCSLASRDSPGVAWAPGRVLAHMVSAYLANGDCRAEEERNNENVWRTGTYIHLGTLLMKFVREIRSPHVLLDPGLIAMSPGRGSRLHLLDQEDNGCGAWFLRERSHGSDALHERLDIATMTEEFSIRPTLQTNLQAKSKISSDPTDARIRSSVFSNLRHQRRISCFISLLPDLRPAQAWNCSTLSKSNSLRGLGLMNHPFRTHGSPEITARTLSLALILA
nr:unnamed protein product [Digitaria exilis]